MTARTPRVACRPALVAITVTTIALGLAGCLSPSLSESQPQHPGRGVAWLIRRSLNMGFSLSGRTVEQVAPVGRYLVDVLEVPEQGEAIAQLGPTLTVRDLATGRALWTLDWPVNQFPGVTRDALYIGNRGYDLASGRKFRIPVRVPAGSAPDPVHDGLLVLAGSPRGSALVALDPRTGAVRWRAAATPGSRFCGAVNADRSAVVVLRCVPNPAGRVPRLLTADVECFDPGTGKLRWDHRLPAPMPPETMTVAVHGSTVLGAGQADATWPTAFDAKSGSLLPGLAHATGMSMSTSPVLGLGPHRTAVIGQLDSNEHDMLALRVVDLAHGRPLWTIPFIHGVFGASYGFTNTSFYVLTKSALTAYALRTGTLAGRLDLPLTFGSTSQGADGQLIPGPVSAGLNAGPVHDAVLAGGLLIVPTAGGSLAAIRISALAR